MIGYHALHNCGLKIFESYSLGNIDPQSDWFGWDDTNSGADIISPGFYSGTQSIYIEQDDDLVYEFGNLNSGSGELIFYMLVPSDNNAGGYFNILHNYEAANSNWAFEFLLHQTNQTKHHIFLLMKKLIFQPHMTNGLKSET